MKFTLTNDYVEVEDYFLTVTAGDDMNKAVTRFCTDTIFNVIRSTIQVSGSYTFDRIVLDRLTSLGYKISYTEAGLTVSK